MVYLIHFDTPIAHAKHYLGYTRDLGERMKRHRANMGARLTEVANERGISYRVTRVWEGGDRGLERKLKNQKNHNRLCPECKEEHQRKRREARNGSDQN